MKQPRLRRDVLHARMLDMIDKLGRMVVAGPGAYANPTIYKMVFTTTRNRLERIRQEMERTAPDALD